MGIQGLLPLLKSIHKPTHLRNFSGQTLGIDAYGWLHRGTVACAIDLAEGKPTRKHIDFALHRVRMLIHFGVKPYLVFDGDYLPSKAHTEKERAERRKESKRVGLDLLRMGRSSQAQLELQKAVDVTPLMARELIEELRRMDVPYVVAPYEADSQLAYLEKQGTINGVISEDSDLLVFGVKCLLTKLDQYGECVMIKRDHFTACREISLVSWTDREFRMMAMLSGCDYLPGIDKMGLKTAYRLVRKHKTVEKVVRSVQFDGKMKVPAGYLEAFQNAERTFLYQWVFCPEAQSLLNLTKLPNVLEASSMPFIGKYVEPELAAGVASGDLDPNTKQPISLPDRFQHRGVVRSRVVQTPDEKQGKPITEFFKKRVPLTELDPNSFTPSPSQQRLLESQPNSSWSASQLSDTRVFGATRSANTQAPSSAPNPVRRTITAPLPSINRASPKRQRLCSESGLAAAMKGAEGLQSATSRFFAKANAQASPSLGRKSSRNKSDEFELWSDDSVVEAVAAATATPDPAPSDSVASPRKRKKLEVFADQPIAEEDASIGDISQDSVLTTATFDSAQSVDVGTPETSFGSFDSPIEHSVFSKGIDMNFAALRYSGAKALRKSIPRTKSTPLFASTPLRLTRSTKVTAVSVDKDSSTEADVVVPNSSPIDVNTSFESKGQEAEDDIIEDEEWPATEGKPLPQQSSPQVKGSEDLLVPESPEETTDSGASKTKLSLGRFAFTG
ncbi:hypothetical protein M409DRAFT_19507 [Zasmidium cellare ATCC 36951]|uniref:Uncharacterized protein n=1 Tax=Zasmidium cellare ATCC 36951 TaxID=1080233 RepID=A0A6A6CXU6_ZASCE|nr:uncharacterized protein M409DRAFT_19507 [Zasmidium cellare ATCC 36951]KAF2170692.1 hypothetical protein M409DRAFT_19507 [Zasmidium cellare ATCC 36951]